MMAYVKVAERRARLRAAGDVDYRHMVSMPIRDMHQDGRVVFMVDVYGVTARDLCVIPGGSAPMLHAIERLGLDPGRYQAWIWDAATA